MKVILSKKAEYDFNESKYTPIPFGTFNAMMGGVNETSKYSELEEVMFFNSVSDYMMNASMCDINKEKPIYVSEKGNVFVFVNKEETKEEGKSDATTDTKENKDQEP